MVYAADNAHFSLPFSQLGLCPEFASTLLLPRLAGHQRAAEKLLLGEAFTAQEAREMGLVNQVLQPDQLLPFVQAQATRLAALPAASLRTTKRLLKGGAGSARRPDGRGAGVLLPHVGRAGSQGSVHCFLRAAQAGFQPVFLSVFIPRSMGIPLTLTLSCKPVLSLSKGGVGTGRLLAKNVGNSQREERGDCHPGSRRKLQLTAPHPLSPCGRTLCKGGGFRKSPAPPPYRLQWRPKQARQPLAGNAQLVAVPAGGRSGLHRAG